MIPILYAPTEHDFATNGIGRLSDCIKCRVTEQRNGIYECEFVYPVSGIHYSDITERCIIYCIHDDTKKPQPFDIYGRSAPIDGKVTFYAHHISYRLKNVILKPFSASSCAQALANIPAMSVNTNPFTFWTDKQTNGNFAINTPTSVREILCGIRGSLLDVYGKGEYEFDGWDVKLHLNRGRSLPVQIRYGKNLTDITHDVDISEMYSAVAPYWASADGTVVMPPEIIMLADNVPVDTSFLVDQDNDPIVTDTGDEIELVETIVQPVPLDLSDTWNTQPSVEMVRAKAREKLSEAWTPNESIKVDFIQLWQTPEYENYAPLQRVSLCDKVSVYYPELGVIANGQQVIETVYDVLMERYESIELGKARTSFAQSLRATVEDAVMKRVPSKSFLDESINRATTLLKGGLGGNVVIGTNADGKPNEILLMDTDDIATAVNVIRMNYQGIGISKTGYDGDYTTAWTIDGHFLADVIDTGVLNANLLKAGIITDKLGKNYWNLETGEFSVSLDPGEEGEVTQADLARVENNAKNYASTAEQNAKTYADNLDFVTEETVDNKISANSQGLETKFSSMFSAKGDTTTETILYYYQSTSPYQLFGGEWSTNNPEWEDGKYIWQRTRYIKGDGSFTESDPVCVTGNTGKGLDGNDGNDAYNLYWTSDNTLTTPKETAVTVTLTAHVGQGESEDIDVQGIKFLYAWFLSRDNGKPELCGKGKTYTTKIDSSLCENRADIWFGLVDDESFFWLVDENGIELTDHNDNALEVV